MGDHKITIESKTTTSDGSARTPSTNPNSTASTLEIKKLNDTLSRIPQDIATGISKALEKGLKSTTTSTSGATSSAPSGTSASSNTGILLSGVDKIAKTMAAEIISTQKSASSRNVSDSSTAKAVEQIMSKYMDQMVKAIEKNAHAQKINVNISNISDLVKTAVATASPDKNSAEVVKLYGAIRQLAGKIENMANSAVSARKSGGGVDLSELGSATKDLAQITAISKELYKSFTDLIGTFRKLGSETNDLYSNTKDAAQSLKEFSDAKKKEVTQTIREGIKSSPREAAVKFASNVRESGLDKLDPKLEKLTTAILKGEATTKQLEAALKRVGELTTTAKTSGKIDDKAINEFGNIVKTLKSSVVDLISELKKSPLDKKDSGVRDTAIKKLEKITQIAEVQTKFIVDDTELRKAIPSTIEVPTTFVTDTKHLDKTTDELTKGYTAPVKIGIDENAVKTRARKIISILNGEHFEFNSKIQPDVDALKIALDKNDINDIQKQLEKLSNHKVDLEFNVDTSSAVKEIDSLLAALEEAKRLAASTATTLSNISAKPSTSSTWQKPVTPTTTTTDSKRLLNNPSNFRSISEVYKTSTKAIMPDQKFDFSNQVSTGNLSSGAKEIVAETEKGLNRLAESLKKLQADIVSNLESQFETEKSGWGVVKPSGYNKGNPSTAFSLGGNGREWTMEIANVKKINELTKASHQSAEAALKAIKTSKVDSIYKEASRSGPAAMSGQIGAWLPSVSSAQINALEGVSASIKANLKTIRSSGLEGDPLRQKVEKTFGTGDQLAQLFKATVANTAAQKEISSKGLVRTVAIPAAQVTSSGSASIGTIHGAERSLPRFAKYESGFEKMYKQLLDAAKPSGSEEPDSLKKAKNDIINMTSSFESRIKKLDLRPKTSAQKKEAESLASDMITELNNAYKTTTGKAGNSPYIRQAYLKAAERKGIELEDRGGVKAEDFVSKAKAATDTFASLQESERTIKRFMDEMDKLGITALDVAKDLGSLDFSNVYDMMNKIVNKGDKSPVNILGSNPQYDRSIRDFETAVREVQDLMPLVEGKRPRRAYQQENVVNVLARTSGIYKDSRDDQLGVTEQKTYIKDLNSELEEYLKIAEKRSEKFGAPRPEVKRLSSLGIPESQAGDVTEYRPYVPGGGKFTKELKATAIKMSSSDLTAQAPFKQFQQAGRNISNVTNAMVNTLSEIEGIPAELPKLRSTSEKSLIDSGRFGNKGYGYNVTAEMRTTASNFEDQIVIAGKLAKVLTSNVQTLVKPATKPGEVTEISETDINKVLDKYMTNMGVDERYKGRADKAFIKDVNQTASTVRGESVDVQEAKLAEVFMNYFGRKFTTRYGSKGVSVTPTGTDANELLKILQEHSGKEIKIDQTSSLGSVITPKSMGEMASELFGDKASAELKKSLIESGNKFIIDLFKVQGDEAIVSPEEAEKNKKVYTSFSKKWKETFGEELPKADTSRIEAIKGKYTQTFGEKEAFNIKPIDVRISSYGAAKRGLQTEFMESIMNNVAGVGGQGSTTVKDEFSQKAYTKLLGTKDQRGALAGYSKVLGFEGAEKPETDIAKDLFSKFGGKGDFSKALEDKDSKALLAQRAAAVEAQSSYYSKIVDEFGKERKGLVGEKFMEVIEEPGQYAAWSKGQVEGGQKGARLNIPAYSAYASTFGENSDLLKELSSSMDVNSKKHWEYMKALQSIQDKDSDVYKNLTEDLKSIDVAQLRSFDRSTGIPGASLEGDDVAKSFVNTILDTAKYPGAFKLKIPTGSKTESGDLKTEDLYIPGAAARSTYPEPLLAGEHGMDQVTRSILHLSNMAKDLHTVMTKPEEGIDTDKLADTLNKTIGSMVDFANNVAKGKEPQTPENLDKLDKILNKLMSGVTDTKIDSRNIPAYADVSESDFIKEQSSKQNAAVSSGSKSPVAAKATMISNLGDVLIGKKDRQPGAMTGVTNAKDQGYLVKLAQRLDEDPVQKEIDNKIKSLQKAKVDYYDKLASTALGKSGSVNELFFNRKIPAVMGKAVTAVVDKSEDIDIFGKKLADIETKYGVGFGDYSDKLNKVASTHSEAIINIKKTGLPVLKQTELGIPEDVASKIPVDYVKKYKALGEGLGVERLKTPTTESGSLHSLLKYSEELKTSAKGTNTQQAIDAYIDKQLVPYVESIRFPFTGTSSIAPFKPRLIGDQEFKSEDGRDMSKNALIVPGIPEGMEGITSIISDLNKRLDNSDPENKGFIQRREDLQLQGGPQEEINRLTSIINELSAAISDVTPKYTAHAQKLDFDGDQIEIHSAKTASARQDIEKHFTKFHYGAQTGEAPLTADVFRTKFLSEAADLSKVGTTGNYVMGEAQGSFEKKFQQERGFNFMKTPFLTEDLEYLDPKESLGILAKNKNNPEPKLMIDEILKMQGAQDEDITKALSGVEGLVPDSATYISDIMDTIAKNNKTIYDSLAKGIKEKLLSEKKDDAVEAQLFKVHTGSETEGLYRLHRLAETSAGFGGGEINASSGTSSEYFKKRYPSNLKVLGNRPEEEFHTMTNELVRFGIQKGMDVKHAGVKPVAGEMTNYLSRGQSGAKEMWDRINSDTDDSLKDLKDFSDANAKSIKLRLGAMSTSDIMSEAKTLAASRGEDTGTIDASSRDELIKYIIKAVGFEGFLYELSNLIQNEALEGLIKQAEQWTPAQKAKKRVGNDIESWARKQLDYQMKQGGVNINADISPAQSPIYGMRTSSATTKKEYDRYKSKYGDISTDVDLSKFSGKESEDLSKKYQSAKATALNLQRDLGMFSEGQSGGAYSDMIRTSVESLHEQSAKINSYIKGMHEENYNPEVAKNDDIVNRTLNKQNVPNFAKDILALPLKDMKMELSKLSDLSGVPAMAPAEEFDIERKTTSAFRAKIEPSLIEQGLSQEDIDKQVSEFTESMNEKAKAIVQLDRIIEAFFSQTREGNLLKDLAPKSGAIDTYKNYTAAQKEYADKVKLETSSKRTAGPSFFMAKEGETSGAGTTPPSGGGVFGGSGGGLGGYTSGPIPVHIASIDPSAVFTVKGLESAGYISSKLYPENPEISTHKENKDKLAEAMKLFAPERSEHISASKYITATQLKGGSPNQVSEIVDKLTGQQKDIDSPNAKLGTAMHEKLERLMEERAKQTGNIDVEMYKEFEDELGNIIGGIADVIEYSDSSKQQVSKVIDIKTTKPEKLEKIKDALAKTQGSNDINDVIQNVTDKYLKESLGDYYSQLNAYLKIFDENATAELRYYSTDSKGVDEYTPVSFTFSPERFASDMEKVAEARKQVADTGQTFKESGRPSIGKQPGSSVSDEELEKIIELAKKVVGFEKGRPTEDYARYKPEVDPSKMTGRDNAARMAQQLASEADSKTYASLSEDELRAYIIPPKIAEGKGAEDFLYNMKTFHTQAKLSQKDSGITKDLLTSLSPSAKEPISGAINKVSTEGPDYESFIKMTTSLNKELKDAQGKPLLSDKQLLDVWKLYRIEVGDYLLDLADKSLEESKTLRAAGDMSGATDAYGEFKNRVNNAQGTMRRGIGKKTDIYTMHKRFVYPELAQAAGVYISPEQMMNNAAEPLGEDDSKLIKNFKGITDSISNDLPMTSRAITKDLFEDLSNMNTEMTKLIANTDNYKRLGKETVDVVDYEKLATRASKLREALQGVLRNNKEMAPEQRKSVDNIVKNLKVMENTYSKLDAPGEGGYGKVGIVPVPRVLDPEMQKGMHAANLQKVKAYYSKPKEEGGPEIDDTYIYPEKIVGASGDVIKNVTHYFKKYGETIDESGSKVGQFVEHHKDLTQKMGEVGSTFGNATRRVIMWGAASRLIYGGISQLQSSVGELADIESNIAELRMVMNPLQTDFDKLGKSALGFAKQYGVPMTGVLKSMKVFAQQGLPQSEVIDRARTSTLASNVTTLSGPEATEALTAAMAVFTEEGTRSVRFLDAWSEVEALSAISADDLANAIKRSAAAAKTAGVTFDQLNGIVAAVGSTTRQTGSEVGTSLRFVFSRLSAEKGPKELAKLDIPTVDPTGNLRSGFDVLSDLSGKWKDLTEAQKMNIAQAIGGTRQYNSVIVLMDQWDEVLRNVSNSVNSKGSAERRNLEVMKTYTKQLEQTKAAATGFKMEMGKITFPIFKAGLKGLQYMFDILTAIPTPIKAAAVALAGFFTLGAKGVDIFSTMGRGLTEGFAEVTNLSDEFKKQFSVGKFEITGKADKGLDTFGLKTLTKEAAEKANLAKGPDVNSDISENIAKQGLGMSDFNSILGKTTFLVTSLGKSFNEVIGDILVKTGAATEKAGEMAQGFGSTFSVVADVTDTVASSSGPSAVNATRLIKGLKDRASATGLGAEAVKDTLKTEGMKGAGKILGKSTLLAGEIIGAGAYFGGQFVDAMGEQLGAGGHKILKDFTTQNTGVVKAIAPMAATAVALTPAIKEMYEYFSKMTRTAIDFRDSLSASRVDSLENLKSVRGLSQEYDRLANKVADINKAKDPNTKVARQASGTYEAPLVSLHKMQGQSTELGNKLASSNINLVSGYDKLGNAVLRASGSYKNFLKAMEQTELKRTIAIDMEVLNKFLDDLSSGSKTEKVKVAFKELAEAFPVIGDLLAKNINVSPAKALEVASGDLNKRINLKQKYPLSSAADVDVKRLQEKLDSARTAFQETYSEMSGTYKNILSPSSLKGLDKRDIENIVGSPELKKAYALQITLDPKFKLVKNVTWQDIMGKEMLTALNPKLGGKLDATAELTKANLESSGIVAKSNVKKNSGFFSKTEKSEVSSGDVLTFYKDLADKYNIAGQQAILKLKGTDEWVVEYFNTRTLKLEERPISDVEGMVDSILPSQKIEEALAYRMDSLNTFVAGAAAGLSGISKKDFKKEFGLGERFFNEVPTTTLLQDNKGYTPNKGYGKVDYMKDYKKDIEEFYFKPMEDLKIKAEQVEKLKLEGLNPEDATVSKDFYDEINRLLDVLKNNQVVLQFKAVFVDLMKSMSESQRVLKEEVAAFKQLSEINVAPGGLTRGVNPDLENIDLGVRKVSDINSRQQLLAGDKSFRDLATQYKTLEMTSQSNKDMIGKFSRAQVQIDDISEVAKGFGATASPERMAELVEKVVPDQKAGPVYELKKVNQGIEKNTASTVDKLDSILENMGDPDAVTRLLSSWTDKLYSVTPGGKGETVAALERVARFRERAEKRGDQDSVIASNKALDTLSKKLVSQVGLSEATKEVADNSPVFKKRFTPEEMQQRAFGGVDTKEFMSRLKDYAKQSGVSDSKEFKNFESAQEEQVKQTIFSSKNLARVAAVSTSLSAIQQSGNRKIIDKLDDQIGTIDYSIANRPKGSGGKELTDLLAKREALVAQKADKSKEAEFYGAVKAISATGFATTELAKSFGMTDGQIKALGVSAAGLYASFEIVSKLMGDEIPESAKVFKDDLLKVAKDYAAGNEVSAIAGLGDLKNSGKKMTKDFETRTKEIFANKDKTVVKDSGIADMAKLTQELDKSLQERGTALKGFRGQGENFAKFADIKAESDKARYEARMSGGNKPEVDAQLDTITKETDAKISAFFNTLGREEKEKIQDSWSKLEKTKTANTPKTGAKDSIISADKYAEKMMRGLEKTEAPTALKQAIVAYIATALADYTSNKTADKTALVDTESIMKRQSEALNELSDKYPELFDKVYTSLQEQASEVSNKLGDISTIDKPLTQNVEKSKNEIKKQLKELQDVYIEEQKKVVEAQRKAQNQLADKEARGSVTKQLEDSGRGERAKLDTFNISRKYSLSNILTKGMSGFAGEAELPVQDKDLSVQKRIYKDADEGYKKAMDSFAMASKQLEPMIANLESLKQMAREEGDFISKSTDTDAITKAKERYRDLNHMIEDQSDNIEQFTDKLRKIGELQASFTQFQTSIYKLRDSLKEIGALESLEARPGQKAFKTMQDSMLGGAHPLASVEVSADDVRMGKSVGMDLQHLKSNRYDLKEAQLKEALQTASGEEAYKLRQQLDGLKYQKEYDIQTYNQKNYNEKSLRAAQPYQTVMQDLETSKTLSTSESYKKTVEGVQQALDSQLAKYLTPVSTDDYITQIKAHKKDYSSKEEYNTDLKRVEGLKDQGINSLYNEVPVWDRKALNGQMDRATDLLKEGVKNGVPSLDTIAISDPIVNKLNETNAILTIIAEKEFGIDFKDDMLSSLGDRMSKLGTRGSDKVSSWFSDDKSIGSEASESISKKLMNFIDSIFDFTTTKKPFEKASGGLVGFASGGEKITKSGAIFGPGTGTSDSIKASVKDKSFVFQKKAVDKYGKDGLDKMFSGNSSKALSGDYSEVLLSNGEYLLHADDAKKFDTSTLYALNEGKLPKAFAEGGKVSDDDEFRKAVANAEAKKLKKHREYKDVYEDVTGKGQDIVSSTIEKNGQSYRFFGDNIANPLVSSKLSKKTTEQFIDRSNKNKEIISSTVDKNGQAYKFFGDNTTNPLVNINNELKDRVLETKAAESNSEFKDLMDSGRNIDEALGSALLGSSKLDSYLKDTKPTNSSMTPNKIKSNDIKSLNDTKAASEDNNKSKDTYGFYDFLSEVGGAFADSQEDPFAAQGFINPNALATSGDSLINGIANLDYLKAYNATTSTLIGAPVDLGMKGIYKAWEGITGRVVNPGGATRNLDGVVPESYKDTKFTSDKGPAGQLLHFAGEAVETFGDSLRKTSPITAVSDSLSDIGKGEIKDANNRRNFFRNIIPALKHGFSGSKDKFVPTDYAKDMEAPGFMSQIASGVIGAGDTLLSGLSTLVVGGSSGYIGAGILAAADPETASSFIKKYNELFTYTPKTETGKAVVDTLSLPFKPFDKAGKYLGEGVMAAGNFPTLAASLDVGMQALPYLLPKVPVAGKLIGDTEIGLKTSRFVTKARLANAKNVYGKLDSGKSLESTFAKFDTKKVKELSGVTDEVSIKNINDYYKEKKQNAIISDSDAQDKQRIKITKHAKKLIDVDEKLAQKMVSKKKTKEILQKYKLSPKDSTPEELKARNDAAIAENLRSKTLKEKQKALKIATKNFKAAEKKKQGYAEGGEVDDKDIKYFSAYGDGSINSYSSLDDFRDKKNVVSTMSPLNEEDTTKWGLSSLDEYNRRMLEEGQELGPMDKDALPANLKSSASDEFMGIKAQYDTADFRKSLQKKKDFADKQAKYKAAVEWSTTKDVRDQSRAAGLIPTDGKLYKVMNFDKDRNLVGLDDSKTQYQALNDLNEINYDSLKDYKATDKKKKDGVSYLDQTGEHKKPELYDEAYYTREMRDYVTKANKALEIKGLSKENKSFLDTFINNSTKALDVSSIYGPKDEDSQKVASIAMDIGRNKSVIDRLLLNNYRDKANSILNPVKDTDESENKDKSYDYLIPLPLKKDTFTNKNKDKVEDTNKVGPGKDFMEYFQKAPELTSAIIKDPKLLTKENKALLDKATAQYDATQDAAFQYSKQEKDLEFRRIEAFSRPESFGTDTKSDFQIWWEKTKNRKDEDQKYSSIESQMYGLQKAYGAKEKDFFSPVTSSGYATGGEVSEDPAWAKDHPNLYGAYGATKAIGNALVNKEAWGEATGISAFKRILSGESYKKGAVSAIMDNVDVALSALPLVGAGEKLLAKGGNLLSKEAFATAKSLLSSEGGFLSVSDSMFAKSTSKTKGALSEIDYTNPLFDRRTSSRAAQAYKEELAAKKAPTPDFLGVRKDIAATNSNILDLEKEFGIVRDPKSAGLFLDDTAKASKDKFFDPKTLDMFGDILDLKTYASKSDQVFHNGGVIPKTGRYFMQGGEVVIPKGGLEDAAAEHTSYNTQSLATAAVKLDASDVISKLQELELKVEDKVMKVEERAMKVEQPDWKVKVDVPEMTTVKVEQPDWKIAVDMPSDKLELKLDVSSAANTLSEAVKSALNTTVKVEVTGLDLKNVGAERIDELAKTVAAVNDKILNVNKVLDDKINLITPNNETSSNIERRVVSLVSEATISMKKELNDIRNDLGQTSSYQRQFANTLGATISEINYKIANIKNSVGVGRI